MKKEDFQEDTRYVTSLEDPAGKVRPSKFYVMKLHSDGMIIRLTEGNGSLRKVAYEDVAKIISKQAVSPQNRLSIPDALLEEGHWKDRKELFHYSSMPHAGK